MYSFNCDYSEGAHQRIMERLNETNMVQTPGYGLDCYTKQAVNVMKEKIKDTSVDIHFLVGGTQTNLTATVAFLRPHQAIIAADSGHVAVHETGAIEATGHKVYICNGENGKLQVKDVEQAMKLHDSEHMVKPKMVYVSNPTEFGTLYTKAELSALYEYCQQNNLIFYIDGARLACALAAEGNDVQLEDYPKLSDVFYIGGTKNGALFGEAIVIKKESLKEDFRYMIKQRGGLLAKGRLLGIQFEALFEDNLFTEIGAHANQMALLLKEGIANLGYSFYMDSITNQQFPIFSNEVIRQLEKEFLFGIWEEINETEKVIRLVTSWATKENEVQHFIQVLSDITKRTK